MGPEATVDLFRMIVKNTKAGKDQEHIHVLIDCNTDIPDRTAAIIADGVSPVPELVASAKRLESAGAQILCVPCNTAHHFLPEVAKEVGVPFTDMLEQTAQTIAARGMNRALVLCTRGTKKAGIYTRRLASAGIEALYPDEAMQTEVDRMIYEGVKAGNRSLDVSEFRRMLKECREKLGVLPVLGCTELPLAVDYYGLEGEFINPSLILARAVIRAAGYEVVGD